MIKFAYLIIKKIMKKALSLLFVLIVNYTFSNAQTTAMDFTMTDCNGQMRNLYTTLDSQNVVILEFFHTCPSCASAADDIKPVYQKLTSQYGNKVRFYAFPEDDTYPCSSVLNWVNSNGFSSMIVPFDSGGFQTAYYGGMGMPTIAVVAGSAHKILYLANQTVAYTTSDTATIHSAIRGFLDSTFDGVHNINTNVSIDVFPKPVKDNFIVNIDSKESGTLQMEITNISGQKIRGLTEEKIQAGNWNRSFPVSLSSGVYFIKGSLNGKIFQKEITIQH